MVNGSYLYLIVAYNTILHYALIVSCLNFCPTDVLLLSCPIFVLQCTVLSSVLLFCPPMPVCNFGYWCVWFLNLLTCTIVILYVAYFSLYALQVLSGVIVFSSALLVFDLLLVCPVVCFILLLFYSCVSKSAHRFPWLVQWCVEWNLINERTKRLNWMSYRTSPGDLVCCFSLF